MIVLENVSKTFAVKQGKIDALKNVSLEVKKGEIFGVIGYSGAGKSTLIRCVNLLEKPTEGTVTVNGLKLTELSPGKLRESRRKIGMIFQGFNLLKTATVYDNIAIPLRLTGLSKKQVDERVSKYLNIVGLAEKQHSYPSELSGGQKQRVAIARALSHEPEVLLSDEATSALDPDTTEAILDLLLKINRELGITILLITHEMHVIQRICDKVAVMENGRVIEEGKTAQIFSAPQQETTRKFVNSLFSHKIPENVFDHLKETGHVFTLSFFGISSEQPALALVSKNFDIFPNILSGSITQLKEEPFGQLLVHLQGEDEEIKKAVDFLKKQGVHVEGVSEHDFTNQ
ncbi:methionine ABC transporter ATP-binding protein [Bacillus canaveralius]|uniref:Methionine ABC transporter ATP-binding protein n=1 Tax=Bacillus canaveralius TaxID=1403243 RepID=A0A2N5GM24_9BACI|nr:MULTISPECIES: ATP-binding cassette domain-containing protein [Bacillus]PLR82863.1 methionine ABC transporter ATP-binding protein [Bacillus canaveralius]PLR85233.1 methionine ABC transporter ATP-binding protein [Bacillus sp. V33-4]PLR97132.1 methionine ABC transporter ATP-binding protein [Bacillus canaveralius]RSK55469.1 ATP-binding cassette domain-containing protein [Bacillus canaveralius]